MNRMYKDLIVEMALKMDVKDLLNFSKTCIKYNEWIWNNKMFWLRKNEKDFNIRYLNDRKTYLQLDFIKDKAQHYYNKSIIEKNRELQNLIEKVFIKVKFPYIGIISKYNINYFGFTSIENLKNHFYVPTYISDIEEAGNLTLSNYARAIGIHYYRSETDTELIKRIKQRLYSFNSVLEIGDLISF